MSNTTATEQRIQMVNALKHMLESLSSAPVKEAHCERCGSLMKHMNACFWRDGIQESWEIPLPYCSKCDPEVGNHASFAA